VDRKLLNARVSHTTFHFKTLARFANSTDSRQPFAYHQKIGEDETINYLHLDYQGSIMAITSQSGNIIEERNYDAWGRPREASS
jgi:hypothetical protein